MYSSTTTTSITTTINDEKDLITYRYVVAARNFIYMDFMTLPIFLV